MADYVLGLDLGQAQDPTALACLERGLLHSGKSKYTVTGLLRYPLGTPYTSSDGLKPGVGEQLRDLLRSPSHHLSGSIMAVDQTGVGRAVIDTFRVLNLPVTMVPITITAGQNHSQAADGWHVPKKDLVGVLQVLFQSGRLEIVESLRLRDTFLAELDSFRVKVTSAANEVFGSWRDGEHDDIVLAVAMAAWTAEKCPAFTAASIGMGHRGPVASPPRGVSMNADFRRWPRGV